MEVKNVIFICFILACVTFNSVQSASFYYRNGREIEIPIENEIIREEIISELKKEPEITVIETEPISAIIREEVIVPVDQLRVAAPVVEVQEPVAVFSEKEESNAVVEEDVPLRSANAESVMPVVVEEGDLLSSANAESVVVEEGVPLRSANAESVVPVVVEEGVPLRSANAESVVPVVVEEGVPLRSANAESVVPVVVEEKISIPIVEEPAVIAAVEEVIPKTRNGPLVGIDENVVVPVAVVKTEEKEIPVQAEAVAVKSTPVEEPPSEQESVVIAYAPIDESDEAVRQSDATTVAPTTRPPFFQAIQNFQNQIQSVFNPSPAVAVADTAVPTTARPGIVAQLQQAVGSVFNRPGASGPIQGFVNAVQQAQANLQGIFRPGVAASPPATGTTIQATVPFVVAPAAPSLVPVSSVAPVPAVAPVDPVDPVASVGEKMMLDEVPVVNVGVQKVDDKVDKVKSD